MNIATAAPATLEPVTGVLVAGLIAVVSHAIARRRILEGHRTGSPGGGPHRVPKQVDDVGLGARRHGRQRGTRARRGRGSWVRARLGVLASGLLDVVFWGFGFSGRAFHEETPARRVDLFVSWLSAAAVGAALMGLAWAWFQVPRFGQGPSPDVTAFEC